jgi:hypothetical protein
MSLGSNDFFVTGTTLTGDHYKTLIISRVGYSRSNSVRLLVLWTVVYNDWGTDIILQVPRDNVNPAENE